MARLQNYRHHNFCHRKLRIGAQFCNSSGTLLGVERTKQKKKIGPLQVSILQPRDILAHFIQFFTAVSMAYVSHSNALKKCASPPATVRRARVRTCCVALLLWKWYCRIPRSKMSRLAKNATRYAPVFAKLRAVTCVAPDLAFFVCYHSDQTMIEDGSRLWRIVWCMNRDFPLKSLASVRG